MPTLGIKASHKVIKAYYESLRQLSILDVSHELAVKVAFQHVLEGCAARADWTLVQEWEIRRKQGAPLRVDGALVDDYRLTHGFWEAKDSHDDLKKEVRSKLSLGYPKDNILFQAPDRAILVQDGQVVVDTDIREPDALVEVLNLFFGHVPPAFEQWEQAATEFQSKVPELAQALVALIAKARGENATFRSAFEAFAGLCRRAINPNLSDAAVEEMLIQHLLTERIFRTVFDNPDFARRNVIAVEIERVIDALTSRSFSRHDFLKAIDRFYGAIESTAATIDDYTQKQQFLNTVYEKFFQGFSVKVADTHGIVYTPQSVVSFMVQSVDDLLRDEFGLALGHRDVHLLDPFVGTGNFIVRAMRAMPKSLLPAKYAQELHCNEVMLLPYYIASMNIEHAYVEQTGTYKPFTGACLVDTFELTENGQLDLVTEENTARVARQRNAPIFVVMGNPPYNAWQLDENDRNRNRVYPTLDKRLSLTYVGDSKATLRNALSDPYVRAFRWASDRIRDQGVVAFITNSNFVDGLAFDGMRKHLEADFDSIYVLDLGGNVRKNPKLSGTTHNVFGIQVGVAITFLVRKKHDRQRKARIHYARVGETWRRGQKTEYLDETGSYKRVDWTVVEPNEKHIWLTEGLDADFDRFIPLGIKTRGDDATEPEAIFGDFCRGACTNNDAYVYDFDRKKLLSRAARMVEAYNEEQARWRRKKRPDDLESFLRVDPKVLKWIRKTKQYFKRQEMAVLRKERLRPALYRPFCKQTLWFDRMFNEDLYRLPSFFPSSSNRENLALCVTDAGSEKPFMALATVRIPDLHLASPGCGTQVFPFWTHENENGRGRRDNITDWALGKFRSHYRDESITKWDIFHYVYALLHHPAYRERYAANLRRELARIPFASDFRSFVDAGKRLVELHIDYEELPEHPLGRQENPDLALDLRVDKARLTPERTSIIYNDFLILTDVPGDALEYKLGNRSALEWVLEQFQASTDSRSGIKKDPNVADDPEAIVRLIGQVITASVETRSIVRGLPPLQTHASS